MFRAERKLGSGVGWFQEIPAMPHTGVVSTSKGLQITDLGQPHRGATPGNVSNGFEFTCGLPT